MRPSHCVVDFRRYIEIRVAPARLEVDDQPPVDDFIAKRTDDSGRHLRSTDRSACGRLRCRQLVASGCVSRRTVEVQRPEPLPARVADLVSITMLDEDQRSGMKRIRLALDDRRSAPTGHV